ncbi:MAG: glycosyltransferase [Clostridia bacterium]|nr:glycosyltransferase [Clostridia bacterium]
MKPLVSIIVPVYNVEKYITGCVTSILTQTYENLQVILVDDGTPDNSGKICDDFAEKDSRVLVVHKENGGLSSARNAGLDVAKGEYIMFIDSDDYIVDNAVEILVSACERYNTDFVQFDTIHTTNPEYSSCHAGEDYGMEILTDLRQMYWKMYKTLGPGVSACTKLHKRELFNDLRFKEGIIHEDDYFTLFALQKVKAGLYLDAKLYYYIVHENSILTSHFSKKKLDVLYVLECRTKEFEKLGFADLARFAKEQYFSRIADLWCQAIKAKDEECIRIIEEKIRTFKRGNNVSFSKKMELIYRMSRINIKFLYAYYLYKKILKQI